MDTCSREYMFASDLIMYVMQLNSSIWEPEIKPSSEKDSPFTPTVERTVDYIWNEKKESVDDLFSTVLQLGSINTANYEVPIKFASHLVTEEEYDEVELLRYCVIAAGFATLFYQNGLKDVPDRCLLFICNTIISFKSKNQFNEESWSDIELLGEAYCKGPQTSKDFSIDNRTCSVLLNRCCDHSSNNFQGDVCDQETIQSANKCSSPKAIIEALRNYKNSENVSGVATTSKEYNSNLPRTKNKKRKHKTTKHEFERVVANKAIETYRPKKATKSKQKFSNNTDAKDTFTEGADTESVTRSQNTAKIDAMTPEIKSSNDAPEKIKVNNAAGVDFIDDSERLKGMEYSINMLNGTRLKIEKVKDTKLKKVKKSKRTVNKVSITTPATEKNADGKFTSEKIANNQDTDEKIMNNPDINERILNEETYMSTEYANKLFSKKETVSHQISKIKAIEQKSRTKRPKNKAVKSKLLNKKKKRARCIRNKHSTEEEADSQTVTKEFIATKREAKKLEKSNDDAKNIYTTCNNIEKVKNSNNTSDTSSEACTVNKKIVKNMNTAVTISEIKHASKKVRQRKIRRRMQIFQNTTENMVAVPFIVRNQGSDIAPIEEIRTIKSKFNKFPNVTDKSDKKKYSVKEKSSSKHKNKILMSILI